MAVARVQEIGDSFQEKKTKLEGFFKDFNFPPAIGGGEDGFQIIEIPSGSTNKENEIDVKDKRILVKATTDMMKAAGYETEG